METETMETASQEETAETTETTAVVTPDEAVLERTVRHHVWAAMGVGLVPIPMVDFLGVAGVQINMLAKIAKQYEVPFARDRVKSIVASLIGGSVPATLSGGAASAVKIIPVVGQSLGAVSMPLIAGASTYAVGQVFIRHFAAGGTFLTFEVEKAHEYYNEMYEKGRGMAAKLKRKPAAETAEAEETDSTAAPAAS